MRNFLMTAALLAVVGSTAQAAAQQAPENYPGGDYEGSAWRFERVRDNVYIGRGTGEITVMSNSGIVINENDVLLVDSHVSPAAAASLLAELREITDKPVRYVVDSHFHFDHAHGNQIYADSIEVIGHEYAREMLLAGASNTGRTHARFIGSIPGTIERIEEQLQDRSLSASDRTELEDRLRIQRAFKDATDAVVPTPPNITLNDRMTIFRGGREIQLHFFGRGHTGGDIVTYLPAERVVLTGDLLLPSLSYLGDAFVPDYIETLERLKELPFEVVIPGHGAPFTDRSVIDNFQAYLADFWGQVTEQHHSGATVDEARQRIDMRAHSDNYPQIRSVGVDREAVERAYELLDAGM